MPTVRFYVAHYHSYCLHDHPRTISNTCICLHNEVIPSVPYANDHKLWSQLIWFSYKNTHYVHYTSKLTITVLDIHCHYKKLVIIILPTSQHKPYTSHPYNYPQQILTNTTSPLSQLVIHTTMLDRLHQLNTTTQNILYATTATFNKITLPTSLPLVVDIPF